MTTAEWIARESRNDIFCCLALSCSRQQKVWDGRGEGSGLIGFKFEDGSCLKIQRACGRVEVYTIDPKGSSSLVWSEGKD